MMTVQVFIAEISSILDSKTTDLIKLIINEQRERLAKLRFDIDLKLSLYAELLVRYQILKEIDISYSDITFARNENGKPYLKNHSEFQFNISHTRNAIAVAFSNTKIGIDIEHIISPDFKVAKRFFDSSERDYVLSHKNPERAFYEIWTKKEAYIKWIGTGLSTPLTSFNVLDNMIAPMIHTFSIGEYLVSTCCRQITITKPNIIIMTEPEMQILFWKTFNES